MNNTILSSASQDVVGVFDQQTFSQVFSDARPIKAKVNETASVMSHPVEDGTIITDHKIINPVDIELSMIISAMPHDEDPSVYDSVTIAVKLTEVKFATFTTGEAPKVSTPKNAKNSKTKATGKKQGTESTNAGKDQSIIKGWTS